MYYAAHHDASAPGDRTLYTGSRTFHLIHFNHRYAFVPADEVEVHRDRMTGRRDAPRGSGDPACAPRTGRGRTGGPPTPAAPEVRPDWIWRWKMM